MTSKLDLRDKLTLRYGSNPLPLVEVDPPLAVERAFVTHGASGRVVITAPVREIARVNAGFTYLRGRFVGAEKANANGAFWTTEDLEIGGPTVAGGPLNWLHDEQVIIGSLLQGELVYGHEKADDQADVGTHIVADAAVWRFLYPQYAEMIEKAAVDGQLYYSMECIAKDVTCLDTPGRPGCGETFPYADYDAGKVCAHLRERSSIRRMVHPVFLGGAIIVPPVLPGWKHAEVIVQRQAAQLTEEHLADTDLTSNHALSLATAILQWANRP